VTDEEALSAFRELARLEGIIPALEPAHAIAWLLRDARAAADPAAAESGADQVARGEAEGQGLSAGDEHAAGFDVLCLSGRGDKDLAEALAGLERLDQARADRASA
jgi:tryptophan synthase beta chain